MSSLSRKSAVFAVLLAVLGAAALAWRLRPLPPNILVIVADDIGIERLSVFGEPHESWPETPTIDALAGRGLVLRRAYANPVCSPTRVAALSGRYVRRRGVGHAILATEPFELPTDEVLIPEILRPQGYTSIAIGKWHLSNEISPSSFVHPLILGFDHHRGFLQRNNYFEWVRTDDGQASISRRYVTRATTDDLIEAANQTAQPWFIWAAYQNAHAPIHTPPKGLNPRELPRDAPQLDQWHGMIEALDMELGRAFGAIDPGVMDNTIIVFFGDNGSIARFMPEGWKPRGGKGSVAEGGIRVPMIVAGPGVRIGRTEALVHVVDLLPTLAELAGADLEDSFTTAGGWDDEAAQPVSTDDGPLVLDGVSFAPLLHDAGAVSARRYSYSESFMPLGAPPYRRDHRSVRDERYKLVRRDDTAQFYDLAGRHDDGPNLADTELDGPAREAFDRLSRVLDRHAQALVYQP